MPESPFAKSRALLVGVEAYGPAIGPLRTPRNDVCAIRHVLEEIHGFACATLEHPHDRLADIRAALAAEADQATPDDRVFLYFAGHGVAFDADDGPVGYFVPRDATFGDVTTYLSMAELYAAVAKLRSRHVLLILDCCFAGAFRWARTRDFGGPPRTLYEQRYQYLVEHPARQVIGSAQSDQRALDAWAFGGRDPEEGDTSPFAATLVAGLRGDADAKFGDATGDGVITATELFHYLRQTLTAQRLPTRQVPCLWPLPDNERGDYLFVLPERKPLLDAPAIADVRNPYKGLVCYEVDDEDRFFGRERVVDALTELTASPLVAIVGSPGVGKSSLLRAGLAPRLARARRVGPFRPGANPLSAIRTAFGGDAVECVDAWRRDEPECEVWVLVDQLEELMTLARDPERTAALEVILSLIGRVRVHVVVTVRSDHEALFQTGILECCWPSGRDRPGRYVVPLLTRSELREVIDRPAAEIAVELEAPRGAASLTDTIVDEVHHLPGGLPLLSFTLQQLFTTYVARVAREGATSRTITFADWQTLDGVAGTLAKRAEELWTSLSAEEQPTLQRVLLRMVTVRGGDFARRPVDDADLATGSGDEDERAARMVQVLVESRLAARRDDDMIELAHEMLASGWPRLRRWIEEADLPLRRRISDDEAAWRARQGDLWDRHPQLDAAMQLWRTTGALNARERKYVDRSWAERHRAGRNRTLAIIMLTLLGVGVTIAAGLAIWQATTSETRRKQLEAERLAIEAQGLAGERDPTTLLQGARLAVKSMRLQPTAAAEAVVRKALDLLPEPAPSLPVSKLEALSDGRFVGLTPEGIVALVAADLSSSRPLVWARGKINAVAVTVDGRRLAVAPAMGGIDIYESWMEQEPRLLHHFEYPGNGSLRISSGGRWIVAREFESNGAAHVSLWSVESGALQNWYEPHRADDVVVDPSERRIAVVDRDATIRVFDLASHAVESLPDRSWAPPIAFAPDGESLVVLDHASEGRPHVLRRTSHAWIASALETDSTYAGAAISVAWVGDIVVAGGALGGAWIWRARDGRFDRIYEDRVETPARSTRRTAVLAVSRDATHVAYSDFQMTRVVQVEQHQAIEVARWFAPFGLSLHFASGERIAQDSWSEKGCAVASFGSGQHVARYSTTAARSAVAFDRYGRLAFSASSEQVRVVERSGTTNYRAESDVETLAFDRLGRLVAAGGSFVSIDGRRMSLSGVAPFALARDGSRFVRATTFDDVESVDLATGAQIPLPRFQPEPEFLQQTREMSQRLDEHLPSMKLAGSVGPLAASRTGIAVALNTGQVILVRDGEAPTGFIAGSGGMLSLTQEHDETSVFLSPVGSQMLVSTTGSVTLYDLADGPLPLTTIPLAGGLVTVAFADDSFAIAFNEAYGPGNNSRVVIEHRGADGELLRTIRPRMRAQEIALSPDGKRLAVAGEASVEVHGLDPNDLVRRLCARIKQFPFALNVSLAKIRADPKWMHDPCEGLR